MNALLAAIEHPLAVRAGWMALSILWVSSGVALLLALWRASMPNATAKAQHRAAVIALLACVLAPSMPYLSRAINLTEATSVRVVAPAAQITQIGRLLSDSVTSPAPAMPLPSGRTVAGSVGALWVVGSTLLWLRLLGGWWVALGMRRRAVPLQSPDAEDLVQRHVTDLGLNTAVQLLQSPEIEAPVAMGVRRPALVMPDDLAQQLGPEALSPLIAHELAHVKRRDYAVNMAQSVLDGLLFFSPAVLWISHTLREAREFCCDDLSVNACGGDRGRYVRVLTSMASLASRHGRQPVLGAAGPRLLTRVRRLLRDGNMTEISRLAVAACAALLVAFVIMTPTVVRVTAAGAALPPSGPVQGAEREVPINWVTRQPGSPVTLKRVVSSPDHLGLRATVQNNTDTAILRLQFAAAVTSRHGGNRVRLSVSRPLDTELGPGETVELGIGLLAPETVKEARQHLGPDLQVMITVNAAMFTGGIQWSMVPNPAAGTVDEAFSLPPAEIPRRLVNTPGNHPDGMCYDDQDRPSSEGAVVAVRDEPGRFVRCANGVWTDYVLPRVTEAATSPSLEGWALDLALDQLDAPVSLRGYTANADNFLYEAVRIENASDKRVTAISFGVIVADPAQPQEGWSMVRTWPISVALPVRAAQTVRINLLPPSQLQELVRTFTASPKITLGVLEVQWEDGSKWRFDVPSGSLDFSVGRGSLMTDVASLRDAAKRPAALTSQECLHGATEAADQKARRQAALSALRVINSVQAMEKNTNGRYVSQTDLATSTFARDASVASGLALDRAEIVAGFEAKVVATADAYSVVLRDIQDPCRFAYSSDEKGIIYTAQPIR